MRKRSHEENSDLQKRKANFYKLPGRGKAQKQTELLCEVQSDKKHSKPRDKKPRDFGQLEVRRLDPVFHQLRVRVKEAAGAVHG